MFLNDKTNKIYDYLIVGCGLYGAVCAHELTLKGYKVLVIDKRNHVAGNIYTEKIENIETHIYGAHIFHTSLKEVWDYVNQFAEFNDFINSPVANYHGELYNLPFNMNTFCKIWNIKTAKEAKAKIKSEKSQNPCKTPTNLEEQAIELVGTTIYNKLIKGYTEKQWGKKCTELPTYIIKRIPLRFTFDNNYFADKYQGIPKCGYTNMILNMLEGIDVKLNYNFFDHKKELYQKAKNIIFTGPIDEFFDYKYGELEYRSLKFEIEVLNCKNYQNNAVINFTDVETPYTRIIEHKHFVFDKISEKTVITKEYSKLWSKGEDAFYPITDDKNLHLYEKYLTEAKQLNNVFFGGRLGFYEYLDMDKTIKKALDFCEKINSK